MINFANMWRRNLECFRITENAAALKWRQFKGYVDRQWF